LNEGTARDTPPSLPVEVAVVGIGISGLGMAGCPAFIQRLFAPRTPAGNGPDPQPHRLVDPRPIFLDHQEG